MPQERPERGFLALALLFGSVLALIVPPGLIFDEGIHFLRAYELSEGHLVPPMAPADRNGWAAGTFPQGVTRVLEAFRPLYADVMGKVDLKQWRGLLRTPLGADHRQPYGYYYTTIASFVPYLPQAAGIRVARFLGGGPLVMFYAARFANLIAAVSLVFLAVRVVPAGKHFLAALALLPLCLGQFASASADGPTISLSFLLFAGLADLALVEAARPGRWQVVGLHGTVAALGLCKFPYLAIALLYLAVPWRRFGSRRAYALVGGTMAAAALIPAVLWLKVSARFHPAAHSGPGWPCCPASQADYLRHHPLAFLAVSARTWVRDGKFWADTCTMACHVYIPALAVGTFLAFVVLLAMAEDGDGGRAGRRLRWLGLLGWALASEVVLLCMYLWWSPVGGRWVEGIQTRYFLPVAPLAGLMLHGRLREPAWALRIRRATIPACALLLAVTVVALVQRFYVAPTVELLSPGVVALLSLATAAVAWGRGHLGNFRRNPDAVRVRPDPAHSPGGMRHVRVV